MEELSPEEYHKDGNLDILIVANDDRTCSQIKDVFVLNNFVIINIIYFYFFLSFCVKCKWQVLIKRKQVNHQKIN